MAREDTSHRQCTILTMECHKAISNPLGKFTMPISLLNNTTTIIITLRTTTVITQILWREGTWKDMSINPVGWCNPSAAVVMATVKTKILYTEDIDTNMFRLITRIRRLSMNQNPLQLSNRISAKWSRRANKNALKTSMAKFWSMDQQWASKLTETLNRLLQRSFAEKHLHIPMYIWNNTFL